MTPFDGFIAVDWSAANSPSAPGAADSIWIAESGQATRQCRTRAQALTHISARLDAHLEARARVLLGFDFGFGYPDGLLPEAPGGVALWEWMAARVRDTDRNENNRFEVAEALNAARAAPVFWGRLPHWGAATHPGLPKHRPAAAEGCFRAVERHLRSAKGPGRAVKSAVHVTGAPGTVGSQILMGLPTLAALRARFAAHIGCWPFEAEALGAPIVLAEIYPSLLDGPVTAEIARRRAAGARVVKDAVQVETVVAALTRLQDQGGLAQAFAIPAAQERIAGREGWILGATHPHCLETAMTEPTAPTPPPLRNDCFALPPGVDWTPVDRALAHLREGLHCVTGGERVAVEDAQDRVLAEDLVALRDNPPTANAAVDGYGFANATAGRSLPLVAGRAAAGAAFDGAVPPGAAVRILTGAPVPAGVDTVVMQEDVARDGDHIHLERLPKRGANTRAAGEDKTRGAPLFAAGHVLRAPDLATLAAMGHGTVPVRRRLRVGVLSTGDELAAPGSVVRPDQIYDANGPMLRGLIAGWGLEPVDLGRAPDDRAAVRACLDAAAGACDAIVTSGGASGGDEDHTSALLTQEGHQTLWRIAIKPGRPLALGLWRGVPVFGLPGNPVAAFVTAVLFARPALGVMAGAGWREPRAMVLPARFEKSKKAGRREFLRARITEAGVEAFASEGSGRVSGLSWADALIDLPDAAAEIKRGDPVRVLSYDSLLRL